MLLVQLIDAQESTENIELTEETNVLAERVLCSTFAGGSG